MIWWFLILGVSTLVVVCVAIALYMRLRSHLLAAHTGQEVSSVTADSKRQSDNPER
jgi:hypothetical protein